MKNPFSFCTPLLLLVSLVTACNKNDDDNGGAGQTSGTCQIASATVSGSSVPTTTYQLSYDAHRRLEKLSVSSLAQYSKTFSYTGDSVVYLLQEGAGTTGRSHDTVSLTDDGFVRFVRPGRVPNVSNAYYTRNTFDAAGQIIRHEYKDERGHTPIIEEYSWSNGDLVEQRTYLAQGDTVISSYEYDVLPAPPEAQSVFAQTIDYGAPFYRTAHRLRRLTTSNGVTVELKYELNERGRVGKITQERSNYGSITTAFSYTCH